MQLVAASDGDAGAELARRLSAVARGFIERFARQRRVDPDDLFQLTFMRAWRYAGSFRGGSSLKTWLYAVTRSAAQGLQNADMRWTRDADRAAQLETLATSPQSVEELALGVLTGHQLEQILRLGLGQVDLELVTRYLDGELLPRRTKQGLAQYRARQRARAVLERHLTIIEVDSQGNLGEGGQSR